MKARVIATGKIIDVRIDYNQNADYIASNGQLYWQRELDFNVDEKFAENCLNGIKQGIVYDPDYWTRLEHQAAIAVMQGMLNNSLLITGLLKVNKSHEDIVDEVTGTAIRYAHALVEKYKKEESL